MSFKGVDEKDEVKDEWLSFLLDLGLCDTDGGR